MIERYTRPEFARLWSDEHRYEVMLEVEILVWEALAGRGIVPAEAVKSLAPPCPDTMQPGVEI